MTRWEYRLELVHTDHDHDPEGAVGALDRLGADGWEAVGIAPATASRHGLGVESSAFAVLLKRSRRSTR